LQFAIRFFARLELWLVLERYGLERLCIVICEHVGFVERLAAELRQRDEVLQSFSVVVSASAPMKKPRSHWNG
jgi:hypothetical protein